MHYTLERLLQGDESVLESFSNARRLFNELFTERQNETVEQWAQWLTDSQHNFERDCGGRSEGQEVMAWAGFAMLFSTQSGFEGTNKATAEKLYSAWQKSSTSIECKGAAEDAATSYWLTEDES